MRELRGKYTMAANSTARTAPEAPSDAYSGSSRCLKYVPILLASRPKRYNATKRGPPMTR